ncbi:MAG: Fic family protein [Sedimentisphaerales bacterium]|nr:Fic family protein [Sedimentisphaerales bacterium]
MRHQPWYTKYSALTDRVGELKCQFISRCNELGVGPSVVSGEVWHDIAARAVHESNWQEGIFVDRGKTKELALYVFGELDKISGPHLDIDKLIEHHKRYVVALKRKKIPIDEIAAYNLSAAHMGVSWIGEELSKRQAASLVYALEQFRAVIQEKGVEMPPDDMEKVHRGFEIVDDLLADNTHPAAPIIEGYVTEGQVLHDLLGLPFEHLLNPMRMEYVHFLHRTVLMGVADPRKCGTFRKTPVHVGNPDVLFAPPSLVPEMMNEFCKEFPTILPTAVNYDSVLKAAEVSYKFVRIHPYHDGNGRLSRLLMNLVLWGHHPPVYLKADKKGRHRYAQALKRADRGNMQPLACLIAMALVEIYGKLIDAVGMN